ncbi:MAG: FAD-dependent oxidoreductase [Acidobacteria bacterium]|nr:FAD-dependent oxidoreductase [Acidobacteriota bacterium]
MNRIALLLLAVTAHAAETYDVVVYGATAGGVVAAIAAAKQNLKVALVEPGRHLGGMTTGGLGKTDHGRKETIGGMSLEFYQRVGREYGKDVVWYFEPHVAEKVLKQWVEEAGVRVYFGHRLRQDNGVKKRGNQLRELYTENGVGFAARIFLDATYEGDLLKQAKVSYTVGREGTAQYGESLAGVRPKDRNHQFDFAVSAYDANKQLLPEIQTAPRGEVGAADKKVQAYNFRMCLSDDAANQAPIPRPANYTPARYELWLRWVEEFRKANNRLPRINEMLIVSRLEKESKTDINNRGPFSTDYIGASWDYPEATYERRAQIWQAHIDYTAGLFHFLQTDARVAGEIQKELKRWGLCADEFVDTHHWPHQLYVREARRLVGDWVMTQKDIQTELTKADVIGMGSYNSDSHNVQRYAQPDGMVQNEGNMEVRVSPYQVPYRVLLPKKKEAANLLVPVCVSSSHVTYSTLRMEPVYMIMGQAAGLAARMAIDKNAAVQDIDTAELTKKLRAYGAVMESKETPQ